MMSIFLNTYFLGTVLNLAGIYMLGACGNCFTNKSGDFNLGGEGQIYLGGFITAILLKQFAQINCPAVLAVILAFLSAFVICGLVALLSALLKEYKNISFLLTSFIFSAAIIPLIDGMIAGRFRTTSGNLLSTAFIASNYRFKQFLPPSPFNFFFFVCIFFCIISYLVIYKTSFGNKLCIFGVASEFSRYSGIPSASITIPTAILSGGFHGLAGAASICGTYYTCHSGFYAGIGWNALSVAIIAKANPLLAIPASLFLALIISAASRYALINNFNFDISSLIQAVILILISIPIIKSIKKKTAKTKSNVKNQR